LRTISRLKDMKIGDLAVVSSYLETATEYSRKLLELGLSPGCHIELVSIAPGGDPLLLKVRDYRISIRKKEADILKISLVQPTYGACREKS